MHKSKIIHRLSLLSTSSGYLCGILVRISLYSEKCRKKSICMHLNVCMCISLWIHFISIRFMRFT